MKTTFWSGKSNFLFALLIIIALGACKKSKVTPEPEPDPSFSGANTKQTPTTNRTELTNDSLFLYARQIYYWNTDLPAYDEFEPRQYKTASQEIDNYNNNLFNLVKASASADYVAGDAQTKYSYIEDITERNPSAVSFVPGTKADVDLEGNGYDTGIMWIPYSTSANGNSYVIFISIVYPGSDAEDQGVKRGWAITKINGKTFGANYNSEYLSIYDELDKSTVTIEGYKYANNTQGEPFNVTLTRKAYSSNPIYVDKVITSGNKKIGYLAYGRFSNEANSVSVLTTAFNSFAAQGVTDLVIDLRYNGGGYVSTAEHLVNLVAPSGTTGVMYKEYFNATMQNKKAVIMKNQPFIDGNNHIQYKTVGGKQVMMNLYDDADYTVAKNTYSFNKAGNLSEVNNVVFLVSRNTASASELVINCLKPKMNVKLVGETTYGKPVGFFPVRLQNRYDVFFSLFETKNSADQGGYFSGMVPDILVDENPTYQLGDETEAYLARAISILNPVTAGKVSARATVMSIGGKTVSLKPHNLMSPARQKAGFVGMIENRFKHK